MHKTKFQFLAATLFTFSMVQAINLGFGDRKLDTLLQIDQQAYARSSAGRSGGGSFTRSSPSTPSSSSTSKPSSSSTSPSPSESTSSSTSTSTFRPSSSPTPNPSASNRESFSRNQPSGGNTIVAPIIINNDSTRQNYSPSNSYQSTPLTSSSSSEDLPWFVWLILLLIGGTIIYFIMRALFFHSKPSTVRDLGNKTAISDLGNNTFTISKLQVALLAQAREVQSRLTELSLEVDTDTPEGLMTLMQESALALIRTPENWTHVSTSSQSVHQDQAEEVFSKLSFEERSKFSEETLVNVGGRVARRKEAIASPDEDPAAYIVVTLLIGTEHDKPLFGEIKTTQELQKALEAIASIPTNHLLVFELLWSPQADSDSLTYDELLTEYSNMIQI